MLFLVAPIMAELLSGTQPPVGFFHPLMLSLSLAFYGPGALLIREAVLHWKKGWPSILLLGLAYGALEEGLMIKNFFDPAHAIAGELGVYGRAVGVNWVFAVGLMVYHSVVSIAVPILIVEAMFPAQRKVSWVKPKLRVALGLLMAAEFCCTFFIWRPYEPPILHYGALVLLTGAMIWGARLLPENAVATPSRPPPLWVLRLIGFAGVLVFVGYFTGLKQTLDPVVDILLFLGLLFLLASAVTRWSSHPAWNPRHRVALATGVVVFFAFFALLPGNKNNPKKSRAGMRIVGLTALVLIVMLERKVRSREEAAGTQSNEEVAR
jgi:hypothetical protein